MAVITLTTDLGSRDHYAASLKGTLLSLCPSAVLVDVTHEIAPFNTLEAAYILGSAFEKFPQGSIHLIGLDPGGGNRIPALVMLLNGHYFIAPDNGILSLICMQQEAAFVVVAPEVVPLPESGRAFQVQNRLAKVAAKLVEGMPFADLGPAYEPRPMYWGEPAESGNALRGHSIHIDRFGNAITNIRKETFMAAKRDRSFQIFIRNLRLQRIVTAYADASKGEALAIFSESGHLEIAIREGSAAQLLGIKTQDMLTIEFYG